MMDSTPWNGLVMISITGFTLAATDSKSSLRRAE